MKPFWKTKQLNELTPEEWEALCDGCGRCCLYKLEDEEGSVYYTRVACRLLDIHACRCSAYEQRAELMPSCIVLDAEKACELGWLPDTCAYRLMALGKSLPTWHPLRSGDKNSVHRAGISVRGLAVSETETGLEQLEDYLIET